MVAAVLFDFDDRDRKPRTLASHPALATLSIMGMTGHPVISWAPS
jgi:hypothetical protein